MFDAERRCLEMTEQHPVEFQKINGSEATKFKIGANTKNGWNRFGAPAPSSSVNTPPPYSGKK